MLESSIGYGSADTRSAVDWGRVAAILLLVDRREQRRQWNIWKIDWKLGGGRSAGKFTGSEVDSAGKLTAGNAGEFIRTVGVEKRHGFSHSTSVRT